MDKLRAIQYFMACARARSITGAARELGVTPTAVAKLLTALEHSLGTRLVQRTPRGLVSTEDGQAFLEACAPALEQLAAAEAAVSGALARVRGTLVVGAPAMMAQHCLLPALPRFRERYPDVRFDIRNIDTRTDLVAAGVDVSLMFGWFETPMLVSRRIGQTRFLVCGSPEYWARRGMPAHPRDLARHECLFFRVIGGTVDDVWRFQRGDEVVSTTVDGWLTSRHRDVVLDAVLAGQGIARMTDITLRPHLRSGRLVTALDDWQTLDSPPVTLLYHPNGRRVPRVRAFLDFVTSLFAALDQDRADGGTQLPGVAMPPWWGREGRASRMRRA